jgi:hypothetical protein
VILSFTVLRRQCALVVLAVDARGTLHVLQFAFDCRPPRVMTRLLDDGLWTATLCHDHIPDIFANYPPDDALKEALAERLGDGSPEELTTANRLAVVGTDFDSYRNEVTPCR